MVGKKTDPVPYPTEALVREELNARFVHHEP
jgi:hypothetical protein